MKASILPEQTFGQTLRTFRESEGMPLRKLAALPDVDPSTLSKIERNERMANHQFIEKLSKIFKTDKRELHIRFISDKVAYSLLDDESSSDILKVAEKKIEYFKLQKQRTE